MKQPGATVNVQELVFQPLVPSRHCDPAVATPNSSWGHGAPCCGGGGISTWPFSLTQVHTYTPVYIHFAYLHIHMSIYVMHMYIHDHAYIFFP